MKTDITLKDGSKINVRMQLFDSSKRLADDDYGTFSVFEDSTIKAENVSEALGVRIISDRNVYFDLNLKTGYKFVGMKYETASITEPTLDADGKFLAISTFNPDSHGGDYLILIDKVNVSAMLDVDGKEAKYYINGKTRLEQLYVGQEIDLTHEDVLQERLGCFYYYYGETPTKVYLTEDGQPNGTPLTKVKITSEMLENTGFAINFGVEAIKRYKFNLSVSGIEYLQENSLKVAFNKEPYNVYELGTYCDEGTEITIQASTLVEGKYTITFNGETYDKLVFGGASDESAVISLDENKNMELKIEPNVYEFTVEEKLYSTLEQVEGKTPGDDGVNKNEFTDVERSQRYNEMATIEFARTAGDRELYAIELTGNDDSDVIRIIIDDKGCVAYVDLDTDGEYSDTEIINLEDKGLRLDVTEYGTVKLTYTPYNVLNISLEYKLYKIIGA